MTPSPLPAGLSVALDATPHGFVIDPPRTALVVIDMQGDFLEPHGWAGANGLDTAQCAAITPTVVALVAAARAAGVCVIYTRECYRADLADCPPRKLQRGNPPVGAPGPCGRYLVQGEACNDVVAALRPAPGDVVIDKPGAGAFYATLLDQVLRLKGIDRLIVTGVTADVCVKTTLHEANDRGYECLLVEDAIASYAADFTAAIVAMARIGVTGSTVAAAPLLAGLAGLATLAA